MAKKRKYRVHGTVTISCSVIVESASKEEARAAAEEASMGELCFQCTDDRPGQWMPGGLDGEPTVEGVEVEDGE